MDFTLHNLLHHAINQGLEIDREIIRKPKSLDTDCYKFDSFSRKVSQMRVSLPLCRAIGQGYYLPYWV